MVRKCKTGLFTKASFLVIPGFSLAFSLGSACAVGFRMASALSTVMTELSSVAFKHFQRVSSSRGQGMLLSCGTIPYRSGLSNLLWCLRVLRCACVAILSHIRRRCHPSSSSKYCGNFAQCFASLPSKNQWSYTSQAFLISSAVWANLCPEVLTTREPAASDDLGGVSTLTRFFGGDGSLAAVAALIGFGGGVGGSSTAP